MVIAMIDVEFLLTRLMRGVTGRWFSGDGNRAKFLLTRLMRGVTNCELAQI